jgi:hypothetical protein
MAWTLRHFPVFGLFGDGAYRIQPIHVDDMAALCVDQGASTRDRVIEAIGPETFTYRELVRAIGRIIGTRRPVVGMPPWLAYMVARVVGWYVGDVVVTPEEVEGLMEDLLYVDAPPAGATKLTDWARANAHELGRRYASELARRVNRFAAYRNL